MPPCAVLACVVLSCVVLSCMMILPDVILSCWGAILCDATVCADNLCDSVLRGVAPCGGIACGSVQCHGTLYAPPPWCPVQCSPELWFYPSGVLLCAVGIYLLRCSPVWWYSVRCCAITLCSPVRCIMSHAMLSYVVPPCVMPS